MRKELLRFLLTSLAAGVMAALGTAMVVEAQLPQLTVVGAVSNGNCTKFTSTLQLSDAGNPCATLTAGVLPPMQGGTGVANSNTITLGGAMSTGGTLTTGGAFTTAGPIATAGTGPTNLVFPNGARTYTLPTATATLLSTAGATSGSGGCANPAVTTSATQVMMGCGTFCVLTPLNSSRVAFTMSGNTQNTTANAGLIGGLRYGTGAAPANGAAVVGGNAFGTFVVLNNANTAGGNFPLGVLGVATGLTPGVAIWFDIALQTYMGGTASVGNVACSAFEM